MNANLHFKDGRDNHRILEGQFKELSEMYLEPNQPLPSIHSAQYAMNYNLRTLAGINAESSVLMCIQGGKK